MNRLTGVTALVAGGTGAVGEGIVRSLLAEDAIVIVPSRSEEKATRLKQYVADIETGNLVTLISDMETKAGMDEVRRQVEKKFGRLDLVIASLGGWWQGEPIFRMSETEWNRIIRDNLNSHFYVISTFVSMLVSQSSGTYVHINGFSAEQSYPGANAVAMAAAAQLSMVKTLEGELVGTGVSAHELILGPVITRSRPSGRSEWYKATEVGDYIVDLYKAEVPQKGELIHRLYKK